MRTETKKIIPYYDATRAERIARTVGGRVKSRRGQDGTVAHVVVAIRDDQSLVWGNGMCGYVDGDDLANWLEHRGDGLDVLEPTHFFLAPGPGYYSGRARVLSSHETLEAAQSAAKGSGSAVAIYEGGKGPGDEWLRVYEETYRRMPRVMAEVTP